MVRALRLSRVLIVAAAIQFGVAAVASAHSLTVTATASCDVGSGAVISFTATSWLTLNVPESANPQVNILFNNVLVTSGAFAAPSFSFSGTLPAPAGPTVVVTAVAAGTWGDGFPGGQSASTTVTIPTDCAPGIGRFTGGGHQIQVGGVRVTRGLTIHCDLLLSNNLEINWGGGNNFHMKEHITTVACTDDPDIIQAPPDAPLDTLIGIGTGWFNNEDGFTVEFTLVDAGEPGDFDKMAIKIYETANPANVVLNVPLQYLTGGNLQAHFDQPHK